MAPIPTQTKKKLQQTAQQNVSASDVYDSFGRPLDSLLRRQKRTNKDQEEKSTINRQHASQYESDLQKDKLIYRDVFPGRKYKLNLSDTTWMGGANVVTIGYTVGNTFTVIYSTAEAPEGNMFEIEIPVVSAVDTLEIRLVGAASTVRSYIEDATTSGSISEALTRLIDSIIGDGGMKDDIREIKETLQDHEERIKALEEKQHN